MTSVPVALVEASNQLSNLQRPLSKVPDALPSLPPVSSVPGRVGYYGEVTRAHRSVAISDAGMAFNTARMQSEVYPIEGPICDLRGTFQVFGESSRYDGRDPVVL
jgi:hypothetical protein